MYLKDSKILYTPTSANSAVSALWALGVDCDSVANLLGHSSTALARRRLFVHARAAATPIALNVDVHVHVEVVSEHVEVLQK